MGDIAMLAGIAKATLYNHFRTRDDVYLAVAASEVGSIATAARAKLPDGLDAALAEAARLIGEHAAVRKIAVDDPAALAVLAAPGDGAGMDRGPRADCRCVVGSGLSSTHPQPSTWCCDTSQANCSRRQQQKAERAKQRCLRAQSLPRRQP